jgi:heme-degrading monooxygenase HmoA
MMLANDFRLEPNSPLRANFEEATSYYRFRLTTMDWKEFEDWLDAKNTRLYTKQMLSYARKYGELGFNFKLVSYENTRKKNDILKSIANICRFIDVRYDTLLHESFKKWLKKKEIKWNIKPHSENYAIAKNLTMQDVVKNIEAIDHKIKDFAKFMLVTGLRTDEAIKAWNNHDKYCKDGIMELFWSRNTKNANAVYCHKCVHDSHKFHISTKTVYRHLSKKDLGCELRFLRKLNYTFNITKIDPMLAEFMQGRTGNVSQRHYYLPQMMSNQRKSSMLWSDIL